LFRTLVLTSTCVSLLALLTPGQAAAQVVKKAGHPRLHHALFELREANRELKSGAKDFGGHRVEAIKAVKAAISQIELCLTAVGEGVKGLEYGPEVYKKYVRFPHIHHAIHELRTARLALEKAASNFGGHKKDAIVAINVAIEQLQLAIGVARGKGIP
jgi:hypothetical protein